MTAILNNPGCATFGGNTGVPGCAFIPQNIVGAILIDKNKVYTAPNLATLATFEALLKTGVNAAGTERIYPIGPFEDMPNDNSTERTKTEMGYGAKQLGKRGKYNLGFQFVKGGLCYLQQLQKFNGDNSKRLLLWTDDNYLLATKSGTAGDIKGVGMEYFLAEDWKFNNGKDPAKMMVEFQLSNNRELNEDLAYIKMSDSFEDIVKGIIDVEVSLLSLGSATATVQVFTKCDKTNLYDAYSTLLADANAWVILKDGAVVTPVSVAAVAATKSWIITLTTPTGAHTIDLVTPAALDTLGVGGDPNNGFESTGATTVTYA
jgi:hypothetical protein